MWSLTEEAYAAVYKGTTYGWFGVAPLALLVGGPTQIWLVPNPEVVPGRKGLWLLRNEFMRMFGNRDQIWAQCISARDSRFAEFMGFREYKPGVHVKW